MSYDIFRPQFVAAETDKTAEPQRATVMKSLIQTLRTQQAVASAEADQLGFLGASFDACPFPMWIKALQDDGTFRMARVNRAFEQMVGVSGATYFAKTDEEIWGPEVAKEATETDVAALKTGHTVESSPIVPDPVTGKRYQWRGVKWPIYVRGAIAGVAGMSTRNEVVE